MVLRERELWPPRGAPASSWFLLPRREAGYTLPGGACSFDESLKTVLWQLILVAAMLCRYERKAIVSSAKEKAKTKPKAKGSAGAKAARSGAPASKNPRE